MWFQLPTCISTGRDSLEKRIQELENLKNLKREIEFRGPELGASRAMLDRLTAAMSKCSKRLNFFQGRMVGSGGGGGASLTLALRTHSGFNF